MNARMFAAVIAIGCALFANVAPMSVADPEPKIRGVKDIIDSCLGWALFNEQVDLEGPLAPLVGEPSDEEKGGSGTFAMIVPDGGYGWWIYGVLGNVGSAGTCYGTPPGGSACDIEAVLRDVDFLANQVAQNETTPMAAMLQGAEILSACAA